jgi:hypothetical protein
VDVAHDLAVVHLDRGGVVAARIARADVAVAPLVQHRQDVDLVHGVGVHLDGEGVGLSHRARLGDGVRTIPGLDPGGLVGGHGGDEDGPVGELVAEAGVRPGDLDDVPVLVRGDERDLHGPRDGAVHPVGHVGVLRVVPAAGRVVPAAAVHVRGGGIERRVALEVALLAAAQGERHEEEGEALPGHGTSSVIRSDHPR